MLFDRNQLRFAAVWTGGYLNHSNRRFGLLNTPTPAGSVIFSTSSGSGWANPAGKWENPHSPMAPLPKEWAKFKGMYLDGKKTVLRYSVGKTEILESPELESVKGWTVVTRSLDIAPSDTGLRGLVLEFAPGQINRIQKINERLLFVYPRKGMGSMIIVYAVGNVPLEVHDNSRIEMSILAGKERRRVKLLMASRTEEFQQELTSRFEKWNLLPIFNCSARAGPALDPADRHAR